MSEPPAYPIGIQGHLDETWIDWFSRLIIFNESNAEAMLTGTVRDQAKLQGLLDKVFNLNLTLLAVNRIMDPPNENCLIGTQK